MRSVTAFTILFGLALGFATQAVADGAPAEAAPAPQVRDGWSGLYIGIGGGLGRIDRSGSNDAHVWEKKEKCSKYDYNWYTKECYGGWDLVKYWDHTFTNPFSDDDWKGFGTVQIGYDRLVHDHLVIGAFADVDIYGGSGDDLKSKYVTDSFALNHTWNLGGKLGFLVTPRLMLYGVGGYTQAGIDKSVAFKYGPTLDDFDTPRGWFAGGGGEVKLRPGVSLKVEYRFADYGSISESASWASYPWTYQKYCEVYRKTYGTDWKADDDFEVQSVRALLVFRPDEPDTPAPLK